MSGEKLSADETEIAKFIKSLNTNISKLGLTPEQEHELDVNNVLILKDIQEKAMTDCMRKKKQKIITDFLIHKYILYRINLPLFSTVLPSSIFMFLSCRPFVVITTLSTGLVGVEVTSAS